MATDAKKTETAPEVTSEVQSPETIVEVKTSTTAKIKVIKPFRDKNDKSIRYGEGTELEFNVKRAADVVERGLGEYVEPVA